MGSIKEVPECGRVPLLDRGSELFTNRFAITATAAPIFLAYDCKEILIHYEAGTQVLVIRGTIPGRKWFLTATANTDPGGGGTIIHSTGSNFTIGDSVTITGCVTSGGTVLVEDGTYTLGASTDADHLHLTSCAYVAGTPVTTGYAVGYRNAVITDQGISVSFPVVAISGQTICSLIHASTGTVSVIAWR